CPSPVISEISPSHSYRQPNHNLFVVHRKKKKQMQQAYNELISDRSDIDTPSRLPAENASASTG
ncbi:hypothetical protein ABEB36_002786, partial [Hypothenemus hampei]